LQKKILNKSSKAFSRLTVILLISAITIAAFVSTYAFTTGTANTETDQEDKTIQTILAQSNLVIRVHNPELNQVVLKQNESVYINDSLQNILKCADRNVVSGELITLAAKQTVDITVDYPSDSANELNIKVLTIHGADAFAQALPTTKIIRTQIVPIPSYLPTYMYSATVNFISGIGGTTDPHGLSNLEVGLTYPLNAFANDGYIFSSWTYSGPIEIDNPESASITMRITRPGTANVYANFITAPDPKISITSGASQSIFADLISAPIVIQRQDTQDRPITAGTTTVTLVSTSAGGFYSDAAGTNSITAATILNGSSSVTIWYKDSSPGTPTLTMSSSGYSSVSNTFTVRSLSGLSVWDQTGLIEPWTIMKLGSGNSGSLAVVSPGYNDSYAAQLTCTAFPDTQGAIGLHYWFDTSLSGQAYTCTFYYKSDVDFMAYFFSADKSWTNTYSAGIECSASNSWKAMTLQIDTLEPATYNWLSFDLYSVGQLQIDNVCFGSTT